MSKVISNILGLEAIHIAERDNVTPGDARAITREEGGLIYIRVTPTRWTATWGEPPGRSLGSRPLSAD